MQLFLETDELNLIANILMEREGRLSGPTDRSVSGPHPGLDLKLCEELLDRVLARDMEFDSDELEQLAKILSGERDAINKTMPPPQSTPDLRLQRKRARLERVLEKLDEVCAMV